MMSFEFFALLEGAAPLVALQTSVSAAGLRALSHD